MLNFHVLLSMTLLWPLLSKKGQTVYNFASLKKKNDVTTQDQFSSCLPLGKVWSWIRSVMDISDQCWSFQRGFSLVWGHFLKSHFGILVVMLNQYCLMQPQAVHACVRHIPALHWHASIIVESSGVHCVTVNLDFFFGNLEKFFDRQTTEVRSVTPFHIQREEADGAGVQQTLMSQHCVQ